MHAIQVRGLLGQKGSEAQARPGLAERAQTVLREAQAACCPAQVQSHCPPAACALEGASRSALPEWRSSSVAALLRSLQSELTAAESALASAVERQASLRSTGTASQNEWSIGAMREGALDKMLDTFPGSQLSKCLREICKGDDIAVDAAAKDGEAGLTT